MYKGQLRPCTDGWPYQELKWLIWADLCNWNKMGSNSPLQPTIYTVMWLCCGAAESWLRSLVSWSVSCILHFMQNAVLSSAPQVDIASIVERWLTCCVIPISHALGTLVISMTSSWCNCDIIMTSSWCDCDIIMTSLSSSCSPDLAMS
jgi:hypothetical protein